MKRRAWFFCGILFVSRGVVADTLENTSIRMEISPHNGSITQLHDKRTGTDFIAHADRVRLFQLMLPVIEERTRRILSWEQQAAVTKIGENQFEIRYEGLQPSEKQYIFGSGVMTFPEPRMDIDVKVTLRLDDDHVVGQIEVINNTPDPIPSVIFPYLGGMSSESKEPRRIVLPSLARPILDQTYGVMTGERAYRYPALLATSWISYDQGTGSLGIEARSPAQAQDAWFALNRGSFHPDSAYHRSYDYPFIAWAFYPNIPGQSQWTSPEILIHVHDSDWHSVAAEHREWHRAQNNPKPSSLWDKSLGFATYRLKREDNTVDWKYKDLAQLADEAGKAGFQRLIIEGWREREGPRNPTPFGEIAAPELGGAIELKTTIAALAKNGVDLIFAFHPTLLNVPLDEYPSRLNWGVRTSRQANAIPVNYQFHSNDYPALLYNTQFKMELDPATPAADYLLGEAARLKEEYGIQNLFLKGIGQRALLSHNRYHGIAPQDVYKVGYGKFLGGLRKLFADGLLITEGFNDLVNPYADAAYTWDQTQHASVLPYSIPWAYLSNDVEALDYRAANISFAHKALINLIVDGGRNTVTRYSEFVQHLKTLQQLKSETASFYANAEFHDQEGLSNVEASAESLVKVFVNPSGKKTGVVVANLTGAPAQVSFESARSIPSRKKTLFRQNAEKQVLKQSGKITIDLKAYEVAIIAIEG